MLPITLRRSPTPEGGDAIDLLLACHARIRHFTTLAGRLLDARDAPAEQLTDAGRQLSRYFGIALPLHVADEDVSIAHRLGPAGKPPEVESALAEMTVQHRRIDRHLDALVPAWARIADDLSALGELRGAIEPKTRALATLMPAHLELEETTIFPWMRRELPRDVLATIAGEMRQRREGVDPVVPTLGGSHG